MTISETFNVKVTYLSNFRKFQKIEVSLVMPETLKSEIHDIESVYLSIRDSEDNPIAGWTKSIKMQDENNQELSIEIHQRKLIDLFRNPQKVEFDFTIHRKLSPGTYVAKIYLIDKYLISTKFRVRKWFWFF